LQPERDVKPSHAIRPLVAAGLLALAALAEAPQVAAVQSVSTPFVGVTYVDRTTTSPRRIHMRVAQVDLRAPGIRFRLSPPAGQREVRRQTTRDFLAEQGAQVAINSHFFFPFPSTDEDVELIGIAASDGRVFSAFESPVQRYAIVEDAPGLNLDAGNNATIVHRDAKRSDGLGVNEPVTLWNTVAGSAQIVTDGNVTLPDYRDESRPLGVLLPGGPGSYSNATSWYETVNARTAIGLSRNADVLTLFTVDARGGSVGMTVREVAATLVADFGVWNALNLDGGGSTSLAMADPATGVATLMNVSSDRPAGRAVGSSLAVFALKR
jgi:hypothetical protein